jgi:D-methionine transport system ATP-binding protein
VIIIDSLNKLPSPQATALRNISLHVTKGEALAIIGRAGAGKSTLLRCINMLARPDSGRVVVDGRDLTALSGHDLRLAQREIGMVLDRDTLLSNRTVRDNIALPLEFKGSQNAGIRAQLDMLINLLDLGEIERFYPSEVTRVQRQRVAIARALATTPKVLLCDDATSGLDPEDTKSILSLLKVISAAFGVTLVLVSKDLHVVKEIADRVAVLDQGELAELGSTFDVLTKPAHEITQSLVRNATRSEMPEFLKARIGTSRSAGEHLAIRIIFTGPAANEPIISDMVRRFGLSFNILYGHIEYIQGAPYGSLAVEIAGSEGAKQAALDFLRANDLKVEILGRVDAPDHAVA